MPIEQCCQNKKGVFLVPSHDGTKPFGWWYQKMDFRPKNWFMDPKMPHFGWFVPKSGSSACPNAYCATLSTQKRCIFGVQSWWYPKNWMMIPNNLFMAQKLNFWPKKWDILGDLGQIWPWRIPKFMLCNKVNHKNVSFGCCVMIVLHGIAWYYMVLHGVAWSCMVCMVLRCTLCVLQLWCISSFVPCIMVLHGSIVWYCNDFWLVYWHRCAGCISQDTYILYILLNLSELYCPVRSLYWLG